MYDELIKRLRETSIDFGESDHVSVMLIEAADAIEDLEKQLREEKVDNVNLTGWLAEEHAKLDKAEIENIKLKEEFAKYRGKNRWIPVTERLPEKDGKYLCTVRSFSQYNSKQYRFVDILVFQDGCFFECGIGTQRVTHWMPLPQPPESESGNES